MVARTWESRRERFTKRRTCCAGQPSCYTPTVSRPSLLPSPACLFRQQKLSPLPPVTMTTVQKIKVRLFVYQLNELVHILFFTRKSKMRW